MSWPTRYDDHYSYRVCTDCGIKRLFDPKSFRGYGPYSYDVGELIARDLLGLLFFGRFVPDFCAVLLIAFSAALQNTSFSNIGPWQFNSAMTISNLRSAVSGWVQLALGETDPKLRGETIVGSAILLCFAAGALLGGVCTLRLPAYALLTSVVLAAAGTLLTLRERQRRLN